MHRDTSPVSPWPFVAAIALVRLAIHLWLGNRYGFHRDELATLTDSLYLDWGYVAYPPVTPFLGRIGIELFGIMPVAARSIAALAQACIVVLGALMAREMHGSSAAQVLAALAVAVAPMSILHGVLFQYVTFDMLAWCVLSWLFLRLLRTENARLWIPIGAAIGFGMMTKYTMLFLVAGVVSATLVSSLRSHLLNRWLWVGVAVSLLVFLPNLVWQVQHDFVSLEFLRSIHERDVRIGRTAGYISEQLLIASNPLALPLVLAGIWHLAVSRRGRPFRPALLLWLVPFILFALAEGRAYYMAAAYPLLIAAGSVLAMQLLEERAAIARRTSIAVIVVILLAGGIVMGRLLLPVAPVNSPLWHQAASAHDNFVEQIGWDDLVDTVSNVYHSLPADQRAATGIIAGNYGEAGAIELLGRDRGLPRPISGINSFWYRGFGDGPQRAILLGVDPDDAREVFESCRQVATLTNRYGVENEESRDHAEILLCEGMKIPWAELWPRVRSFG